jgi:hypothetical protein
MATVTGHGDWVQKGVFEYLVAGMTGNDSTQWVDAGSFDERSVHIYGTLATDITITIQARNATAATGETAQTPTGGDATLTAAGIIQIATPARQYRVLTTGAAQASDSDFTVAFLFRD